MGSKTEYLVVDTTAFINNSSLHEIGTTIVTVQDVVDEITNKRQLRRLVVLPYDLQIKDVFPENIKYITEFSKKTGDYPSLSATDIKVMALTYQLEKEKVGTEHLRKEPQVNRTVTFSTSAPNFLPENTAGFYFPKKEVNGSLPEDTQADDLIDKLNEMNCSDEKVKSPAVFISDENVSNESPSENVKSTECDYSDDNDDDDYEDALEDAEYYEDAINVDDILVPVPSSNDLNLKTENSDGSISDDDNEKDDDDDDGWITPKNIVKIKKGMNDNEEEAPKKVACITADFAMQNVMKQLGLNVLSVEGRMIKHLRTFILRCYACFKTTSIMTKLFCPNCGNKTLKKVSVSLAEDGTQIIHINPKKRLTARGKRFSLPTPKGGKHTNNPILCEDQRIPRERASRLARMKNDPLSPDYIAGFSPFIMRDINSKSAMLGIRPEETKHWMRRNPNEAKRQHSKKKK